MSEKSCPSKFIDYLDSFREGEHGVYEYYTLFSTIQIHYIQNELGLMNPSTNPTVKLPPPTKPIQPSPEPIDKYIDVGEIECIQDLVDLIDRNPYESKYKYNIDLRNLSSIREELVAINSMIGMHKLKCNVVEQLLYFIQELHKGISSGDFKHTIIYGPPGTGKTEVAKLIGQMYSKIGILSKKNVFKKATRNDLIAGYLGQTAIKTKALITECLGGVLFIDEVYSLGNADDLDSFSRECIDTLCEALSDHKDDLMVIIAGYEKEIDRHFFSANQGLESRFVWRFTIDKYTPLELRDIFCKKVLNSGWRVSPEIANAAWFSKHKELFTNYGRDMERLFLYVKISHSKRVFGKPAESRRVLTEKDMASGLDMFLDNRKKDDSSKIKREILTSMYV